MLNRSKFMTLSFSAVLVASLYSASALAEQSIPKPAFKLPDVSCLVGARFLTAEGSKFSDLIEIKVGLQRTDADRALSLQTTDLGHGISLITKTTFSPKGSIEHKGADMLIVNSKVARREDGKLTVLASTITTSDANFRADSILTTASNFQNPEVETVLINSGESSRGEIVRKNLIPAGTFDNALLTCNVRDL